MGHRTVKRVALDFKWPLNKVWEGYLNPYYGKCPDTNCENGYTGARRWLQSVTHILLMIGEAGLKPDRLHPWLQEHPLRPGILPDKTAADLTAGLAGRSCDGRLGHDACDNWSAEKKIIKAAGLNPKTWGICPTCKGDAADPKTKKARDKWKEKEPPKGDGWQLWETCSEGSPVSPVFKTAEELADWCATNATIFASEKMPREKWLSLILDKDELEVGSLMVSGGGYTGSLAQSPNRK